MAAAIFTRMVSRHPVRLQRAPPHLRHLLGVRNSQCENQAPQRFPIGRNEHLQRRARRKGVDGFSVESAGSGKRPFSPSSDSLTLLGHPLCSNFAITKLSVDYVMHSSFAYRQFNSSFTCGGETTILPYELIHSRNHGTIGHNVGLPRT
ncbi:hypothetical protein AVEN_7453-1 [Araneus ventricosus]|uniref:Uncharacterized protein n=1 Tax=Araneus ventricosus TaxID=182803 RepID=A0A4Y2BRR1_ARAVE|nr:hypothetical protein AVEN_7453-1 [Araneus ventricosus]